jgi:hypothetical protein
VAYDRGANETVLDTWTGDVRADKDRVEAAMLIDARSLAEGTEVICDLAVVGAGPAGNLDRPRLRDAGGSHQ